MEAFSRLFSNKARTWTDFAIKILIFRLLEFALSFLNLHKFVSRKPSVVSSKSHFHACLHKVVVMWVKLSMWTRLVLCIDKFLIQFSSQEFTFLRVENGNVKIKFTSTPSALHKPATLNVCKSGAGTINPHGRHYVSFYSFMFHSLILIARVFSSPHLLISSLRCLKEWKFVDPESNPF